MANTVMPRPQFIRASTTRESLRLAQILDFLK